MMVKNAVHPRENVGQGYHGSIIYINPYAKYIFKFLGS